MSQQDDTRIPAEDAEGQMLRAPAAPEEDDTEGHSNQLGALSPDEDDTEGHSNQLGALSPDERKTQGQS